MNTFKAIFSLTMLLFYMGCSLPPERPITEFELSNALGGYQFVESPEEILAVLNKEGVVVIPAKQRGRPLYVKVLATSRGLIVESYPRIEAPKSKTDAKPKTEAPKGAPEVPKPVLEVPAAK